MLQVLFFGTLKDFARKTENLEARSQCSRSLCSLNCEPLARALAGFDSQGRGDIAGGAPACVSPPVLALRCLSPLQTLSSCAQLCA